MALTTLTLNSRFYAPGMDKRTGLIPLYAEKKPGSDYIGSIRRGDDGNCFYIGYPTDQEIPVKTLDDVSREVDNFRKICEEKWVDARACDLSWCNGFRVGIALQYFATKMGWKPCDYRCGHGYNVGSSGLGVKIFNLDSADNGPWNKIDSINEAQFQLTLSDSVYLSSPKFTKYEDAMEWLKSKCWAVLFGVGADLLGVATKLEPEHFTDAELKQVQFNGGIFPIVNTFSLRDHLIKTLEKQLKMLKRSKTKDGAEKKETN